MSYVSLFVTVRLVTLVAESMVCAPRDDVIRTTMELGAKHVKAFDIFLLSNLLRKDFNNYISMFRFAKAVEPTSCTIRVSNNKRFFPSMDDGR